MKVNIVKLSVVLPTIIGLILGAGLFTIGYTQDAPGACAIGLALAFALIMLGIRNAGIIKKGYLAPILLFCFAAGGIVLNLVLYFDQEFEDTPGLVFIGLALGVIMIIAGAAILRHNNKHER